MPFENTYANVLFPYPFSTGEDENYIDEEMIVQRNGKYGVLNFYNSGESYKEPPVLVPCEYEEVYGYGDSYYVVKNKNGYGAYIKSHQIVPCKYESVGVEGGYFIVKHNGKYGVFGDSTQILPCKYERVSVAGNNSFIVKMSGKYGVYTKSSQLLSCVYDLIEYCGKYSYDGGYYEDEIMKKSKMSLAERLKSVAYKARKEGKLQWFDEVGRVVSLPQTISDVEFSIDVLLVRGNGKWGVLNDTVMSAFEYDSIEPLYYCYDMDSRFYSGFSYAYKNGNKTLIDSAFNKIIPMSAECELLYKRNSAIIESWEPSSTSLYGVKYKNNIGKWGVVDVSGKQILKCEYDNIKLYDEETMLFKVRKNGKWGMVDTNAKQLLPCKYDTINAFYYNGSLYKVYQNSKWGVVDSIGKQVLKCEYEEIDALDYYEGELYRVQKNGKWGLVDKNGKQVLKCEYEKDAIARCGEGVKIKISGKWGMVDKEGKLVLQNVYEEIEPFLSNDLFKVQQNGKWGLVDEKGFQVLQCIADEIEYDHNGCIKFVFEGKEVRVDKSGKPCK